MTEKITRAQAAAALAALEELEELAVFGDNARIVRSYLAQQPTEDEVRKAHEIIATLRRTLCDENAGDPGCPCLDCQDFDVVASALPPLPEEK